MVPQNQGTYSIVIVTFEIYLKHIVYIIIHQMLYFYIYLIFLQYVVEVHYDVLFTVALNWEIE